MSQPSHHASCPDCQSENGLHWSWCPRKPRPNAPSAEWVFVSCEACGHWRDAELTKDEVADWLRVHRAARLRVSQQRMERQSTCPTPCGSEASDG